MSVHAQSRRRRQGAGAAARVSAGFTMIELVIVMVLMGILSALAASRLFDRGNFDVRDYADQTRSLIRYAQKLAIAQGRPVYVSMTGSRVALCYAASCASGSTVAAPGGNNSGSTLARAQCKVAGSYAREWLCEAMPAGVTMAVTSNRAAEAGAAGSYFFFDAMGQPYNAADAAPPAGYSSTFSQLALTFSAGGASHVVQIEPVTGYVH